MTIEHLDWHSVLSQVQKLSKLGSMQIPGSDARILDPHINAFVKPAQLLALFQQSAPYD
ncbi:hypothetical protein GL2_36130 [Microbulbifer sp. GL-2]|nr:hypothetical protein GL2_36130 [Microbulbifer sp. GL-2]